MPDDPVSSRFVLVCLVCSGEFAAALIYRCPDWIPSTGCCSSAHGGRWSAPVTTRPATAA
ncbi:MAG: hypothetical protein LH603_15200 [Pseudonocardia sp.]|nr:hypothetical protein [Pseudonocardia sp.]